MAAKPSTVEIVALTTFLDDRSRYEQDETYQVAPGLAAYFGRMGWARVEGVAAEPQPQDVTLDIHDSDHGHEAEEAGADHG